MDIHSLDAVPNEITQIPQNPKGIPFLLRSNAEAVGVTIKLNS